MEYRVIIDVQFRLKFPSMNVKAQGACRFEMNGAGPESVLRFGYL